MALSHYAGVHAQVRAPALQASQVTAGYGGFTVVSKIDLAVESGSILTLIGPNGSGKSTLAKSLISIVSKYGGVVELQGEDISTLPTHEIVQRGVGYVAQVEDVFPSLTVAENIEIPCLNRPRDRRANIAEIYATFPRMFELRNRKAWQLSGGERRMVSVARALVSKPRLVIADEPSSNLSPAAAWNVWQELRRIADAGLAVLAVEQNVGLALEFSDSVSVMVEGALRVREREARLLDLPTIFRLFVGDDDLVRND